MGLETFNLPVETPGETLQKETGEQDNVISPGTQRRNMHRKHIEPEDNSLTSEHNYSADALGRNEVRLYDEKSHLIARKVFTVGLENEAYYLTAVKKNPDDQLANAYLGYQLRRRAASDSASFFWTRH